MFAKSLLTGGQVFSSKSFINPVNYYYIHTTKTIFSSNSSVQSGAGAAADYHDPCAGSTNGGGSSSGNVGTIQLNANTITALDVIELNYVKKMADRDYLSIPISTEEFLLLNNIVTNEIAKQTNSNLRRLLQLANDALTGSLHSRTLTVDNTDLNLQVLLLNRQIEDILSGKNEVKAMGGVTGEFVITKTFKLAPLYSYYIYLYGMPAYGVGFEPSKLTMLAGMLQKYNINPYG